MRCGRRRQRPAPRPVPERGGAKVGLDRRAARDIDHGGVPVKTSWFLSYTGIKSGANHIYGTAARSGRELGHSLIPRGHHALLGRADSPRRCTRGKFPSYSWAFGTVHGVDGISLAPLPLRPTVTDAPLDSVDDVLVRKLA